MGHNEGKVELTWSNKSQRLITLETPDDGIPYEWVAPTDYRVAEVRLLYEVAWVGERTGEKNYLVRGDALHALTALCGSSAGPEDFTDQVKLAYLDPPFNTGGAFANYEDNLEKSIWLTMMRDRLKQVEQLLHPDGTIWVHCDDTMQGHLRVMMDEVFLAKNFVATVIWEKVYSPRMDAKQFSSSHDYILVYSKSPSWQPNRVTRTEPSPQANRVDEAGRTYRLRSLRKEGKGSRRTDRPNLWYSIEAPDGTAIWPVKPDGTEGRWRWGEPTYQEKVAEVDWQQDRRGVWQAYLRQHDDEAKPIPPMTLWSHEDVGHNHGAIEEIKRLFPNEEPFATPKPERLLQRIIEIATNPGDVVLDCFLGSGTTAATAHKLSRRWVGVEVSTDTIDRFALPRLSMVVAGTDPGGITEDVDWHGGGGFVVLDVEPSMFAEDGGTIVLADWAAGSALGETVAAQLGFWYDPAGPFCGRKGRTRLAVIDGLVNTGAIDLLLEQLDEREVLLVCGTGLDPEAATYLSSQRLGSSAQLIPAAILSAYGRPRRWAPALKKTEPVLAETRP